LPAIFLWGAYFAAERRWKAVAALAVLAVLTIEQTPVLFFGLGLYLIGKLGWRTRRAWLIGAGVCAGAMLLWRLETRLIWSFPEGRPWDYWSVYFGRLAPSWGALLRRAGTEPLRLAGQIFFPLSNLRPLWNSLAATGGLCLVAPWEMLVWTVNFLPHLVSDPGHLYHDLRLQYAAYCVGPLWWAAALGTAKAYGWLERRKQSHWLLVLALLLGIRNLCGGSVVLLSGWDQAIFSEGPAVTAQVPAGAAVWAIEDVASWLSCRSFIKVLLHEYDGMFTARLFVPDYILISREWVDTADRDFRDRLLTFAAGAGYVKAAAGSELILLKHPSAPLPRQGGRPPSLDFPRPGPAADAYAQYLLAGGPAPHGQD
jgi:hypothetical protein